MCKVGTIQQFAQEKVGFEMTFPSTMAGVLRYSVSFRPRNIYIFILGTILAIQCKNSVIQNHFQFKTYRGKNNFENSKFFLIFVKILCCMKKFMFLLMLFFGVAIHAQERNERTVSTVIEFVINTDTIIQNENY